MPCPEHYLSAAREKFVRAGFDIIDEGEVFPEIRFYDVGAKAVCSETLKSLNAKKMRWNKR